MTLPSLRLTYFLAAIAIAVILLTAIFLQYYAGLTPCPLCILQRYVFMALAAIFFLASLFKLNKFFNCIISLLALIIASLGTLLAGRQVWLQHSPFIHYDCGASLEYMLQAFPLKMVLQRILAGSAECSAVDWRLLGLSLADWSLLIFTCLVLLSIRQFCLGLSKHCWLRDFR